MMIYWKNKKYDKNPFPSFVNFRIDRVDEYVKIVLEDSKNKCDLDWVLLPEIGLGLSHAALRKKVLRYKVLLIRDCC